jgi:undecaprenyl-diphosphatase
LAIALSFAASQYPFFPGDLAIAQWVQSIDSPIVYRLMWGVSALGTVFVVLPLRIACAVLLAVAKRPLSAMFVVLTISAEALSFVVKELVNRPRPGPDLVRIFWFNGDSGFPSGHVMSFIGFYGFLFFLAWTQTPRSSARTITLLVLGALILLVGVSRVFLGSHWPSDILGGYLIGSLWLLAFIRSYDVAKCISQRI